MSPAGGDVVVVMVVVEVVLQRCCGQGSFSNPLAVCYLDITVLLYCGFSSSSSSSIGLIIVDKEMLGGVTETKPVLIIKT